LQSGRVVVGLALKPGEKRLRKGRQAGKMFVYMQIRQGRKKKLHERMGLQEVDGWPM